MSNGDHKYFRTAVGLNITPADLPGLVLDKYGRYWRIGLWGPYLSHPREKATPAEADYSVAHYLRMNGPTSTKELALALGLSESGVKKRIDRMRKRGVAVPWRHGKWLPVSRKDMAMLSSCMVEPEEEEESYEEVERLVREAFEEEEEL